MLLRTTDPQYPATRHYPATRRGRVARRGLGHRQRLAVALALLWGVYALLGASGAALCAANAPRAPRAACAASAAPARDCPASPAPVMHCAMCRSMSSMKGGRMRCCCAAKGAAPAQRAVLRARCDQGAPAVLAAVTSWPVTVPEEHGSASATLSGRQSIRAASQSAPSRPGTPPTPPPCLQ